MVNLIQNASKYTDVGGQIFITAERTSIEAPRNGKSKQQAVAVRIRDTGIGIPGDFMPHIFDPFIQCQRTIEQGRGGLGVGLTIVRRTVEMHGGTIEARSDGPGHGSEFIIRLPLSEGPPEPKVRKEPSAKKAGNSKKNILIVDDNPDQVSSLAMLLEDMGHKVHTAENGPDALETITKFKADIALIDIGLPGMDGYEIARRIREQPQFDETVLVAQTGWGQDEDRRRSKEAGFSYHLVKPIAPEELERIINGAEGRCVQH